MMGYRWEYTRSRRLGPKVCSIRAKRYSLDGLILLTMNFTGLNR